MDLNETLQLIMNMLIPALFSLLGMAALGSPAIALLGEIAAKAQKKVFYDKYGQQTGALGLLLTVLILIIYGVSLGIFMSKAMKADQFVLNMQSPLFIPLVTYAVFTFVGIIYFITWKKMRNLKPLHMVLGAISAVSALACVGYAINAKLAIALSMGSNSPEGQATANALLAPMSAMSIFLVLAAAAGLSVTYLVLRREKDDFGRDYYNFSLKLAARWSMISMAGFMACQAWLFTQLPQDIKTIVVATPLAFIWAGIIGIGALCIVLWFAIARSESPLRLKGLSFVNAGLFWIMHTLNATLYMNFFSMI